MAKWKINLMDTILFSIPILAFKKADGLIKKFSDRESGLDFITAVAEDLSIETELYGRGNLPKTGAVTIVSNHPGGPDVFAAILAIAEERKDMAILANELICVPSVEKIVIPVSTMAKKKVDLSAVHEAYKAGKVVVFFAAGKNSRYNEEGLLRDRKWRTSFLDFAEEYKTPVNILRIEGENSPLFYKVSKFRNRFKQLKNVPLENIFQLRELLRSAKIKVFLSKSTHHQPGKGVTRAEKRAIAEKMHSFLYTMDENNLEMKK